MDALAQGEWHEAKREDLQCKTVGFVVFEDDQQIELAGTITEGMCNNSITIPKQMITKRKAITFETTKRKSKGKKPAEVGGGKTVIIKEKETIKEAAKPKKKEGDEFKEEAPKW